MVRARRVNEPLLRLSDILMLLTGSFQFTKTPREVQSSSLRLLPCASDALARPTRSVTLFRSLLLDNVGSCMFPRKRNKNITVGGSFSLSVSTELRAKTACIKHALHMDV